MNVIQVQTPRRVGTYTYSSKVQSFNHISTATTIEDTRFNNRKFTRQMEPHKPKSEPPEQEHNP